MRRPVPGFSLLDATLVLLFVGVVLLAATPQLQNGLERRRQQAIFYQQLLQLQLERYREDHQGRFPPRLEDLTRVTDLEGRPVAPTSGADEAYGPYLERIPREPLSGSDQVLAGDSAGVAGWRYWPDTGRIEPASAAPR